MNYYVISDDGQKFGPADVATLNQWARENRLFTTSMVEEAETGIRLAASAIPGIQFPPTSPPPSSQFQQAPSYPRTSLQDDGSEDVKKAWIFGAIGFLCCPILFSVLGIVNASKAQKKGHPSANAALIFCICSLVIGIGVNAIFRISAMNNR